MSFRELRNFTERMRCLGYHRLISLENFRNPNFELVADILYWLAERLDPNCDLTDDISCEAARVDFLKAAARVVLARANLRLNVRKLYQADGYAVQELHKVAAFLYQATSVSKQMGDTGPGGGEPKDWSDGWSSSSNVRGVSGSIIECGGKLYSNLSNETQFKEARDRAMRFIDEMSLNVESDDHVVEIEKAMRQQIAALSDHLSNLKANCSGLEADRIQIQARIERKQNDLDRAMKRLKTIKKVKPAFMAEYESLENELKILYRDYMEKFTNLTYLEDEQRRLELQDEERRLESERHLRKMRRHLRDEELRILRGEQQVDENDIDNGRDEKDDDEEEEDQGSSEDESSEQETAIVSKAPAGPIRLARPGAADPRGRRKMDYPGAGQVIGSMIGNADDVDDDDDDSAVFNDAEEELEDEDETGSEEDEEKDDEDEEDNDDQDGDDDTDF